ncbi:MAG: NADH-quinone oxidoreductase subunit B family protein [Nitrososphaerota archaeon]
MGIISWARSRSPWIVHLCTGACNACDIEILAALTPRYDLERFGVLLKGSPRHADIFIVTGPITRQMKDRVVRIYEQIPDPKFVVAVGTCTMSGGAFRGCYNVYEGLDAVIPVDAYIAGCPVKPEAIIQAVATLVKKIRSG